MRLVIALVFVLLPLPALAESYPFEGRWDCGVGEFTFTATSYDPGGRAMEIMDVTGEDGSYTLSFEDDYQLLLAMNPDGTMNWFSPASGDGFTCNALP